MAVPTVMTLPQEQSALSPLRQGLFRSLWIAAVVSYTGTWMQNVGTGWLMTSLTMSPLMVGLVQSAITLPTLFISIPAGALADMMDRRRLLLITQVWMATVAAALGFMTIAGYMTPWRLIGFTSLLGVAIVLNEPAWQSVTPDIVSRRELHSAVALNSAGYNVARAIGPALGGLVIAAGTASCTSGQARWLAFFGRCEVSGEGVAFLLNAASFLGVIIFLWRWTSQQESGPVELGRMRQLMREGMAFAGSSQPMRCILARTAVFSLFASSLWAMLPIIARHAYAGPIGYGLLLACLGAGAISGALLGPRTRKRFSVEALVSGYSLLFAAAVAGLALVHDFALLGIIMLFGGAAWLTVLVNLNVAAQTLSPLHLRSRSLSMYILFLQGGMAAGSALWGWLGSRVGVETSLKIAAAGMLLVSTLVARSHRLDDHSRFVEEPVTA